MKKKELKEIIHEEREMYVRSNYLYNKFTHNKRYMIWKYLSYFRKSKYYAELIGVASGVSKIYAKLVHKIYVRKKNIYSEKTGVEIANGSKIGRRIDIWHGGIVINCELGDDCVFRGNTIIGNKGLVKYNGMPTIGNGVEIGAGAVIIGKLDIADGCEIGANAVVTKSFITPGSIIVGVPGRLLEKG